MKKLFTMFALLSAVVFVGCSKDDDGSSSSYKYKMYTEPYLNFGSDMDTVKDNESRTLYYSTSQYLYYYGENSYVNNVWYSFDSDKYQYSWVIIPASEYNIELLVNFLDERYVITVYDDDTVIFYSKSEPVAGTVYADVISDEVCVMVGYFEFDGISSKSIFEDPQGRIEFMREQFRSLLNQ